MTRLLEMVGGLGLEELRELSREMLRQRFDAETGRELKKATAELSQGIAQGLKSWPAIATPHLDVASGCYSMAEFATDLF